MTSRGDGMSVAASRAEARLTPTYIRLREARERAGLTQVELAEASGIPQSTISRLETGYTRAVDLDTLDRLARALGLKSAGRLLGGQPD